MWFFFLFCFTVGEKFLPCFSKLQVYRENVLDCNGKAEVRAEDLIAEQFFPFGEFNRWKNSWIWIRIGIGIEIGTRVSRGLDRSIIVDFI